VTPTRWFSRRGATLFLCSCSCLLAGCGSSTHNPFAYDAKRPLAAHDDGVAMANAKIALHVLSYAGASGTVNAFLFVPKTTGPHPAVLFLHGSGGNREDLLAPAAELAQHGVVTMTISQPKDARTFRPLVVNAERALDLLAARKDVDSKRLGLVGFSLGAQTAAVVAGVDRRLTSVGLIAGRGAGTPRYWLPHANADLFFQDGTRDDHVPHAQLVALIKAAPGHPRVRWYDTKHGMNTKTLDDQVAWQAAELGLR
jgi:dienelactone hydrolase